MRRATGSSPRDLFSPCTPPPPDDDPGLDWVAVAMVAAYSLTLICLGAGVGRFLWG